MLKKEGRKRPFSSTQEEIENQGKQKTDDQARHDREGKSESLSLNPDVPRQFAQGKMEFRTQRKENA